MLRSIFKQTSSPLRDQRQTIFKFIKRNNNIPTPNLAGFVDSDDIFTEVTESCHNLCIYNNNIGWNIPEEYKCIEQIIEQIIKYEASINPYYINYGFYLSVYVDPIQHRTSYLPSTWFVPHLTSDNYQTDMGRLYIVSNNFGPLYVPINISFAEYLVQYNINGYDCSLEQSGNTLVQNSTLYVTEPHQIYVFDQTYILKDRVNYYKKDISRTLIVIDVRVPDIADHK
jgi:hypothetical protein